MQQANRRAQLLLGHLCATREQSGASSAVTAAQTANSAPSIEPILELFDAFRRSKVLFAAIELGIFEALAKDNGATCAVLARQLQLNEDALTRLLDALVGLKLLARNMKRGTSNSPVALYAPTELTAAYLLRSSPHSMVGYAVHSNRVIWPLFGNLEASIRTGKHSWAETFGAELDRSAIFDKVYKTDVDKNQFMEAMNTFAVLNAPLLLSSIDLSQHKRLVDMGGGTSPIAVHAVLKYPHLQVQVADLPKILPTIRPKLDAYLAAEARRQGLSDAQLQSARSRLAVVPVDFFDDKQSYPSADVFSYSRIFHDWSDEKTRYLLKRTFAALPRGGRILVAEQVMRDDRSGPLRAQLQSLNMQVQTEGKERTIGQFTSLLEEAGFRDVRLHKLMSDPYSANTAAAADRPRDSPAMLDAITAVKP